MSNSVSWHKSQAELTPTQNNPVALRMLTNIGDLNGFVGHWPPFPAAY